MKSFQNQIPLRHRARSQSFLQETFRHLFQRYALDTSFRDELRLYFRVEFDLDRHCVLPLHNRLTRFWIECSVRVVPLSFFNPKRKAAVPV